MYNIVVKVLISLLNLPFETTVNINSYGVFLTTKFILIFIIERNDFDGLFEF